MKKKKQIALVSLVISVLLSFPSCYQMKAVSKDLSYKDPQTIGGTWDITTASGLVYEDAVCTYWGTDDDTAIFSLPDGRILALSGSYSLVQSEASAPVPAEGPNREP